ncbi:MAG: glucose 1-dehydrogenase [Candidatus Binatia bacterium]|nr:glucose 1-dehydrogenase [Candidatus Binatia bacterium]
MNREQLDKMFDLSGRVAIVTGGSRGIGKAIAGGFAAAGAKVVIASRKANACDATVAEIEATGGEALAVPTHLGDIGALENLVRATVDRFGGVDIVVNNAANALALPVGQITAEAFDKSIAVNLRGPLFLVQFALPYLQKSEHASVINVISAGVFTSAQFVGLYTAGKAGLRTLTRTMAHELASHNIRVNAIAPGTVDTDMVRNTDPAAQAAMRDAAPVKRMAAPEEMIGMALYLASDAGSFATGQTFIVDGGMTTS